MINFGTKHIDINKAACDADHEDRYTLSLAGTPEVNGAHVATLTFHTNHVGWWWSVSGDEDNKHPINGGVQFSFTSAGETYTIGAKAAGAYVEGEADADLDKVTYTVVAVYAPDWANGEGEILPTVRNVEIPCFALTGLRARAEVCPSTVPCYTGADLYYLKVPTGDECLEGLTSVTMYGVNVNAATCEESAPYSVSLVKNTDKEICGATHADSSTLYSGVFWAAAPGTQFKVLTITYQNSSGTRECADNTSYQQTGFDAVSVVNIGACIALLPSYDDVLTPESEISIGSVGLFSQTPAGANGGYYTPPYVPPNLEWDYPSLTRTGLLPDTVTITVSPTCREFLEQTISVSGTATAVGSMLGISCGVSVPYTITKACGSSDIVITRGDAQISAFAGTIPGTTPTQNNSSTNTSTVATLQGLGTNGRIELTAVATMSYTSGISHFIFDAGLSLTLYKAP